MNIIRPQGRQTHGMVIEVLGFMVKGFLFGIITILAGLARASSAAPSLEIRKEAHNRVIVSGNCEQVKDTVRRFAQASDKMALPPIDESSDSCSANIINLLPDFYSEFENKSNKRVWEIHQWTNCWGFALAVKGVLLKPFPIAAPQLRDYIESGLCTKITEPEPGDIGLIRKNDAIETDLHGFIYISPTVHYSKLSGGRKAPVMFEVDGRYSSINGHYDMSKSHIEYQRCTSWENYVEKLSVEHPVRRAFTLHKLMMSQVDFGVPLKSVDPDKFKQTVIDALNALSQIQTDDPAHLLKQILSADVEWYALELELEIPYDMFE